MEKSIISLIQGLIAAEIQKMEIEQVPLLVDGERDFIIGANLDFVIGIHPFAISIGKPIPSEYIYLPKSVVVFRRATISIRILENKDYFKNENNICSYSLGDKLVRLLANANWRIPQGRVMIRPRDHGNWKEGIYKKNESVNLLELQFNIYFFPEISSLEVL
jgi:hypothetical protein